MTINIKDHQDRRPNEPLFTDNMGLLAIDDCCRQHMICAEEEVDKALWFSWQIRRVAELNKSSLASLAVWLASALWNRRARRCSNRK